MAFAFGTNKVKIYPIEDEASFRNTYLHVVEVDLTALNSDTALALATLAAADTTNASNGLYLATLLTRAYRWVSYFFKESQRAPNFVTKSYLSNAAAGGSATEAYVVTGLKSTDTILAVTPAVATANAVYYKAYSLLVANGLSATYSGDPGAAGKILVAVSRAVAVAGDLTGSDHLWDGSVTAPNFTFAGGTSTPTTLTLSMLVETTAGYPPIRTPGV